MAEKAKPFERRTAWVTGASSGLGLHTARALAGAGWLVIGGARSFSADTTPEENFIRLPLDVTSAVSRAAFAEAALARSPRVDALLNCAGVLVLGSCEETATQQYLNVMQTNYIGMTAMVQAALPHMRRQGGGRIVNFSSVNGLLGVPFQSAYTASKHAIEGYSECLAMEVKPFHIQVCLIEPGDHRGGSQAYRAHAAGETTSSPYAQASQSAIDAIHRDESNGSDPDVLGRKVVRLLSRRRMPFRRCIAKPDQHLAVWLHRLLPPGFNFSVLSGYYLRPKK